MKNIFNDSNFNVIITNINVNTNYISFALLVSILLVMLTNNVFPQQIKITDNKKTKSSFFFGIETEFTNSSKKIAMNGDEFITDTIVRIDTVRIDTTNKNDTIKRAFTTNFSQQRYSLKTGYVYNGLNLFLSLPFVNFNIEEKTMRDTAYTVREVIRNSSSFYAEGIDFLVNYAVFNYNFLTVGILGNVFVPFNSYKKTNVSDDSLNIIYAPNYVQQKEIEHNRSLETNFGTVFDLNFKQVTVEIGGIYNYRNWNENFANRLIFNLLFGLETVADARLFVNFTYTTSLGDVNERYCSFWKTTLWEKFFDTDVGFKIFFTEEFYIQGGYSIRLWGENTLAKNILKFNLGYFIK